MRWRSGSTLACLALAACVAVREPRYQEVIRTAEPALEDIFLIPGLHGEPPRIDSLSSDGRWLLARWRPVVRGDDGALAWGEDQSPHLLSTGGAPVELGAATSLVSRLEQHARAAHQSGAGVELVPDLQGWKPGRIGRTDWSDNGARLAVEWEHALLVLDLEVEPDPALYVLYVDPPEKKEAKPGDASTPLEAAPGQEDAEPEQPALPERLGSVRSLEFDADDTELVVRTKDELFVFPLTGAQPWPMPLASARWVTRELEPSLDDVQMDRARTRFFSGTRKLGHVERVKEDGTPDQLDAQFFELDGARAVVLEGMQTIASLETSRLSPDGRFVFACEIDRSKEPAPTLVPDYLTDRVTTIEGRRQLADDTWPQRKLWMWSTADGSRSELVLPGESEYSFAFLGWAPQVSPGAPARCAWRRIASDYRTAEVWVWSEGQTKLLFTERDARWVGGPGGGTRWSRDGQRLLFASECTPESSTPGRNQLFEIDVDSGDLRQLTEVEGELSSFDLGETGRVAITASREDPARRCVGWIDGASPVCFADGSAGVISSLELARGGGGVAFRYERLARPAEIYALDLSRPNAPRPLTRTIPRDFEQQRWIEPVKLSAHHADGTRVRAHVYLPRATSLERPDRERPCVVFIHGAGYLQNVTDSMTEYAVNLMFHSRLASMGYVVADVDYRGSAGYGNRFRTDVQNHLGELELHDIAAIVDELARLRVIDGARVGCYGGSYGGFLTLMALFTEPERWACGAALRSVTDWRTYAPGYTQPRLGRPSTNAEAYARSSPIDHADKLEDPLLILHGLVDTNVFAQDSIRLIEKLIDCGKDFEAMLYPSQGHGFDDGRHWLDEYRRIERFLVEHLGAP